MSTLRRNDLLTVQALRAIAALMVVAYHGCEQWNAHFGRPTAKGLWDNGSAGVDIFFVISGLVMTISAARLEGRPLAAWTFLRQRLTRILPLYWLATTAKIAAVMALPMLVSRTQLDPFYVAGSYALLPVHDWTGDFHPVLPVGWTLTYEMLFYLLVSVALVLRVPILRIALPALALLALGAFIDASFSNTIVLEFLYGVGLGMMLRRGAFDSRTPRSLQADVVVMLLLAVGFAAIALMPVGSGILRPITWGVPAACIVASAVALEHRIASAIPAWLLAAGDASYAIYLTHGFVVPLVFVFATRAGLSGGASLGITLACSLLLSLLAGHATHVWVEQPVLRWFRRRPAVPSVIIAG